MHSSRIPLLTSTFLRYLTLTLIITSCAAQQPDLRKFSAISGELGNTKVTPQGTNYTVPYAEPFANKPDVGLSVYNMQFDYNPEFSINVIQERSTVNSFLFYVVGRPSDSNIFNELFIMYIASDYDQIGIFMPSPRNTTVKLGVPSESGERSENFVFNYKTINKVPIYSTATNEANIRVSVYLAGITAFSQTTANGYSRNYAFFSLAVTSQSYQFYTIQAKVKSSNGDVLIKVIQFTVVYFDTSALSSKYQIDSNSILASNFGGTFFKSSYSAPLQSLPEDPQYQNTLQYFFGISQIECSEGQTINLLAVQRFNFNANGKLQNLVLTFETQRNTYILRGMYNYIQYKPRNCNDSASCGVACDPTKSVYSISNIASNLCAPCLYFCQRCENGFNCTVCPATRTQTQNGICICTNNTMFDKPGSKECQLCFQNKYCQTCQREGVCLTCYQQQRFSFNYVLRTCECSPGYYDAVNNASQTNRISRISSICLACAPNCIYCTDSKSCQACTVPTYLATSPQQIQGITQTCFPICNSSQQFNPQRKCVPFQGDPQLFNSAGRLGFEWDYKNANNQLVVDLLFSQANMTYYFYENGVGYQYSNTTSTQNLRVDTGQSSVYYDDGNGYIKGYSQAAQNSYTSSVIQTRTTQENSMFDETALQGQYYGIGEAKFYKQEYKKRQPQAEYLDQFGIPFGKYQLSSTTISKSATYLDAIRNNMQFLIDGQSLPYTIKGLSGNHFQLTVRTQKSYLTSNASIAFKNPALVRSGETALQTPTVSKQLDRVDYYTQSQLATASSLRDRTATIVQILWGICKYALFLGFGWAVMPLMLILQYIFGHNYITSQIPLNLDYFLTSFADFRNPSILFNPQRNQFDASVVNHGQIYKRVAAYEEFDRGIDFMKNSFQFFFVPLVSFALQFFLIGINLLLSKIKKCSMQIPLISKYLQPRLGHHAAAYTLVQALPVSFFFFGQLQDTRYNHVNSPNAIYPSFNTGISYASFFASIALPLVLLAGIYNYFKNRARSGKFMFDKVKGADFEFTTNDPAMIADPLWGGNPYNTFSYGFGAAMFFLPLLAGFVLSFFTKSYPWQLAGLLLGFLGLTSFAAASSHFDSKIPKYFFVGIGLLMLAYELVHAGIGSNRALLTYDQWNTGYLGIGIIYALILTGIIFSGYLIYKLIKNLYENIIKPYGCLSKIKQKIPTLKTVQDQQINLRDNALGRRERRQTTQMKSKINYFNPQYTEDRLLNNGNREQILNDMNLMDNREYTQDLQFVNARADGSTVFRAANSGQVYNFPFWSSQILRQNLPLFINSKQNIFRKSDNSQIGTVRQFQKQKTSETESDLLVNTTAKKPTNRSIQMQGGLQKQSSKHLADAYNIIVNNKLNKSINYIVVDGKNVEYRRDDDQELFYLVDAAGGAGGAGRAQRKIGQQEFLGIFMRNQNKVAYNGEEYLLRKTHNSDDDEDFYFLESPRTKANFQISKQQLFTLLANQGQLNYRQNIQSTSLLPQSGKAISQQDQYVAYNPISNRSIVFTKQTEQYLINGKKYEKIGEDGQNMFFRNIQTGSKISMKKSEARIRSVMTETRTGSFKAMTDNKLSQDQGFLQYQGQKHKFTGIQNNKYSFANIITNNIIYLSGDELAQLYGFKKVSNQLIQNISAMPVNSTRLRLVKLDEDRGCYVFQDPRNLEKYQMAVQFIDDVDQGVYIDQNQNFWYKGVMLEAGSQIQSDIDPRLQLNAQLTNPQPNINYIPSNQTIASTASLSQAILPTQLYNLQFLSPDYNPISYTTLPSQKDILDVKQNVIGANVLQLIEKTRSIYPNCKVFIESVRLPSQKFLFQ